MTSTSDTPVPPDEQPPAPVRSRTNDGMPIRGASPVTSLVPFGLFDDKPRDYRLAARALWARRASAPYVVRLLTGGVCEACALGPRGLLDEALSGPHLCNRRLAALADHTALTLAPADLVDIARLQRGSPEALRALGRLSYPFVHRRGERGFSRVGWDEAVAAIGERLRGVPGERLAMLAGLGGPTNETFYALAKAARLLGSRHVGPWGRTELTPLLAALGEALGTAAPTGSLHDIGSADLVVVIGGDPIRDLPETARYLQVAKGRGARVVFVGPRLPAGMQASWVPTRPLSALFGTRLADDWIQVAPGGDRLLLGGVLRALVERGAADGAFIARHTVGWEAVRDAVLGVPWSEVEAGSGVARRDVEWLAELFTRARSVTSLVGPRLGGGHARPAMLALVALHLSRGLLGEPGSAILPLVERSGEYALSDCGLLPDTLPGGRPLTAAAEVSALWGDLSVCDRAGLDAEGLLDHAFDLDLLWSVGGAPLVDDSTREALGRPAVRVHQATFLSPGAVADPGELLVLLPAANRFEQPGGGTVTNVERRVRYSPEIAGHPVVGEALSDVAIIARLVSCLRPDLAHAFAWRDGAAIREEMEAVHPQLAGLTSLRSAGDWLQWGGARLHRGGQFKGLPGERARFVVPGVGEGG